MIYVEMLTGNGWIACLQSKRVVEISTASVGCSRSVHDMIFIRNRKRIDYLINIMVKQRNTIEETFETDLFTFAQFLIFFFCTSKKLLYIYILDRKFHHRLSVVKLSQGLRS